MSNNFHKTSLLKIHELETFGTKKIIIFKKKKLEGCICQKASSRVLNFPYISLYFFPRTIFRSSSRLVRYTDKCMEISKHDWTLSGTATSLLFCS